MMQAELVVPFLVDKDVMVAELPYAGERLSMVIILPVAREGLPGVEKQLDEKRVNKWLEALRPTTIDIALAKITLRGSTELGKRLAAMGMPDAFSRTDADFSGMTGTPNIFIDKVIHEAFVRIDEQGTEAAAATAVGMRTTSIRRNPQFIADHPFVFFIRDRETGLVLFTGRLSNPDAAG